MAERTPLDVPSAILQRRSIKRFRPDPLPTELVRQLLELTVAAPSSWNLQDWRIVVVEEESRRAALAAACLGQSIVHEASLSFVFAGDAAAWTKDLEPIFLVAERAGAWSPQLVDYFRRAIPEFQQDLGDRNREYAVKDAMIAATHLVLAAESLGLASTYLNGWDEAAVKEVIGAGDDPDLSVAVIVPVGWAAEARKSPGRLELHHTVFRDHLGQPFRP